MNKMIAVFGSSTLESDHPDYEVAVTLGEALARSGFRVASGGYDGVMEAVSKGAASAGGHVIGVTSTRIFKLRGAEPNHWIAEQIHFESLRERMLYLVDHSDGYVVMPGGFGTMVELLSAWEFLHARELPPRPLVLYRPFWGRYTDLMWDDPQFRKSYWQHVNFADTPQEIVTILEAWQEANS